MLKKATTVHTAFSVPVFVQQKPYKPDPELKIPDKMFKETRLIIIDEVSMLDLRVLEAVDQKLRKMLNIQLPFGGKSLILGGDRLQLVPPSGRNRSVYSSPAIMDTFFHVELDVQVRQIADPDFCQFLRQVNLMCFVQFFSPFCPKIDWKGTD